NVGTRGLVVRDLTLQGGRAERNGEDGGGVLNAGGGETRLEHTRLRDHHARQGGGVFNEAGGDLRLTDVTLERNTAEAAGGLASDGSVRLVDTRFVDNEGTGDIGGARVSGSG